MSLEQELQKALDEGTQTLAQLSSPDYALHLRAEFFDRRHKEQQTATHYAMKGVPLDTYIKLELADWKTYVADKESYLRSQPLC